DQIGYQCYQRVAVFSDGSHHPLLRGSQVPGHDCSRRAVLEKSWIAARRARGDATTSSSRAVVAATTIVDAAAIVGSVSVVTLVNICTGRVRSAGLARTSEITTSSKETAKATTAPERTPGAASGRVTVLNVVSGEEPRLAAARSNSGSMVRRFATTATVTNGIAKPVCAITRPRNVPDSPVRRNTM